jgi:hypothetical protein
LPSHGKERVLVQRKGFSRHLTEMDPLKNDFSHQLQVGQALHFRASQAEAFGFASGL